MAYKYNLIFFHWALENTDKNDYSQNNFDSCNDKLSESDKITLCLIWLR